MEISKKVVLLGRYGVGKTSLIRQFVHQQFSEEYLTSIGVKIDKKVVNVNGTALAMIIWDIAGESSQQKIPSSYKLGSQGVIYVFDVTRASTYEHLENELFELKQILSNVPIRVVGNKKDLLDENELDSILSKLHLGGVTFSSAKTGENVEALFNELALEMLR